MYGTTSRVFQLASHLHPALRAGLLLREFKLRLDKPVSLVIGKPVSRNKLESYKNDPVEMMDFLRRETYKLSPIKIKPLNTDMSLKTSIEIFRYLIWQ